jgi:hypothetical protein
MKQNVNIFFTAFSIIFLLLPNMAKGEWIKYSNDGFVHRRDHDEKSYFWIDKSLISYVNNNIKITYMDLESENDLKKGRTGRCSTVEIDCEKQKIMLISSVICASNEIFSRENRTVNEWTEYGYKLNDDATADITNFMNKLCDDKVEYQKNELIRKEQEALKIEQDKKDKEQREVEERKRIEKENADKEIERQHQIQVEKENQIKRQEEQRKRLAAEEESRKQQEIERKRAEEEQQKRQKEKEIKDQLLNM